MIEELKKTGASVSFYDPYIPEYKRHAKIYSGEKVLTTNLLQQSDLVVITAAHTTVDYEFVQKNAIAVFDTKNAMKNVKDRSNIEIL